MSETFADRLSRVRMMAEGSPTWDLSDNDRDALAGVLEALDGQTITATEGMEIVGDLRSKLSAANRRIEELEKALRSEREGIAKWLENQTWREIPSDPSALAAEIRALSTPSARAEEPKCTCGHKLHPFNACTARSGGTANPCSCLGGGSVPPSEEPEECWACRGYGHISSWGEPSADKRDRKCLECRGEGKVPAQAKEGE